MIKPLSVDHDGGIVGEIVHGGFLPEHMLGQFNADGDFTVFRGAVAELAVLVGSGCPDAAVFFQGEEMVVACGDFNDAGQGDLAVLRDVFQRGFCPVPAPDGTVFFEDQEVIPAGSDGLDVVDAFHLDGPDHVVGQAAPECLPVCAPLPEESVGGDGEGLAKGVGYADDLASLQGFKVDFQGMVPFFRPGRTAVVAPAPEGVVFIDGDGVRDGGACHGNVVHDFGRDGRAGWQVVATPAAGCSPSPEGVVVFDGEDGGVAGFDEADVVHDFDRFRDIGCGRIGIRFDLAEIVVTPSPCGSVFFHGKRVAHAGGGGHAFDVVHDFDGFDAFCPAVGDVAPCPELPFRIDVKALGGACRKTFAARFVGVHHFPDSENRDDDDEVDDEQSAGGHGSTSYFSSDKRL